MLITLLLLAPSKKQPNQTSQAAPPEDEPSNVIQIPAPFMQAEVVPLNIGDILRRDNRTDGATIYHRNQPITAEAASEVSVPEDAAKLHRRNRIEVSHYFLEHQYNNIWNLAWNSPTWPAQLRQIIVNEPCVNAANTINVVASVVAALEMHLGQWLANLNLVLQQVFPASFQYGIQVRHQSPSVKNAKADILITLEFSCNDKSPDTFLIPERKSVLRSVRWASAERFGTRLLDTYQAIQQIIAAQPPGMAGQIEACAFGAPCLVLHIIENKKPGIIDRMAFTNPELFQETQNASKNVGKILPQLKRYALEYNCPSITLNDYFEYLTFQITPGAIGVSMRRVGTDFLYVPRHGQPSPIFLRDVQPIKRPRMQIYIAIIRRLETAGILVGGMGNLVPCNPTNGAGHLVDISPWPNHGIDWDE
ncbi:hypothetical protein DL96DRAFT_1823449 [Flagelloscypha sp. PMI_526]|nr:hypothetical protein DL96DRAFT_1823449 [Flagelloscypha sp. PMI_526]